MKIRVGLTAATLLALGVLGPLTPSGAAHAETTDAPSTVDPALVQQLQTVWLNGHRDAWARDGGTFTATSTWPGNPLLPETHTTIALDVASHRWSVQTSSPGPYNFQLPSHDVFIGRTRYHQTAPVVRAALHVHHAPAAAWTSTKMSAHGAATIYPDTLGGSLEDAVTPASGQEEWQTLTVSTDDQGYKTYTGSYREQIGNNGAGPAYYTPHVVVRVDQDNRPVSWDESGPAQAVPTYEVDSTLTSHQTWQWSRPAITAPAAHNSARPAVLGEKHAWRSATNDALVANDRDLLNHKPVTVSYLHRHFKAGRFHTTPIRQGLRLTEHAAGHTFTWKIVVRHGRAVAFAVAN